MINVKSLANLPEFAVGFARLLDELMKEGSITKVQADKLQEKYEL